MVDERTYQQYFNALISGKRSQCNEIVQQLLAEAIEPKDLYTAVFQRSMYKIGELWQQNKITVANEHLATAITEGLLSLVYPQIFAAERIGKIAVIACVVNELHQIGGKMAADIFELHGWDGHFLGAGTSLEHFLGFVDATQPDLVGLSLAMPANLSNVTRTIEALQGNFASKDLLVGGRAFAGNGKAIERRYRHVHYIPTLNNLEQLIEGLSHET